MSALAVLALLGLAVFLPVVLDNEDDEDAQTTPEEPVDPVEPTDPVDPVDPLEPTPLRGGGTAGDDTLNATPENAVIDGGAGDDVLGARFFGLDSELDGGPGNDTLTADIFIGDANGNQSSHILTGGSGDDIFEIDLGVASASTPPAEVPVATITDFTQGEDRLEIFVPPFGTSPLQFDGITQTIAPDSSLTDITVLYTDPEGVAADIPVVIRVIGAAGLSGEDLVIDDGTLEGIGTAGDDTLSSTGAIRGGAPAALLGLAGDDLLIHEASDSSGPLRMEGGAGDDTLIANEVEFGTDSTLDGGAGDDVLRSDLFFFGDSGPNGSFDTFTTGTGADRIEISYLNVGGAGATMGLIGTVTDFDNDADVIFIDPRWLIGDLGADESTDITETLVLREDPAGAFTDVDFTYTAVATGEDVTGTLRLEGVTGLTPDSIAFGQIAPDAPAFVRPGISVGT